MVKIADDETDYIEEVRENTIIAANIYVSN